MEKFIINLNGILTNVEQSMGGIMSSLALLGLTPMLKFDVNYYLILIVNKDDWDAHEFLYDLMGPYEIEIEHNNLKIENI